jgi:hypothetical protein
MTSAAMIGAPAAGGAAEPESVEAEAAEAREAERPDVADGVDWQRLWLATQRRPWTTLALVPIGEDAPTPLLALELAEVGRRHRGGTIVASDATLVSLSTLQTELDALTERARCAERAIVALPPLLGSPAGLALAQAADAVILCVALGSSAIAEAEQILDEVGRDRVLGSVILRERKTKR